MGLGPEEAFELNRCSEAQASPPARRPRLTLLLDIDGTLVHQEDPLTPPRHGYALLSFMVKRALSTGMPFDEVDRRIESVLASTWWRWTDFLHALDLDVKTFWPEADEAERLRTKPLAEGLPALLTHLHDAGHRLVITSNNPTDGISHKLRLAGLDASLQADIISARFGTENARANKAQPAFWRHVLHTLNLDPSRSLVIGNDVHEDGGVPCTVGITRWLPIGLRTGSLSPHQPDPVRWWTWPDAVDLLTAGAPKQIDAHLAQPNVVLPPLARKQFLNTPSGPSGLEQRA